MYLLKLIEYKEFIKKSNNLNIIKPGNIISVTFFLDINKKKTQVFSGIIIYFKKKSINSSFLVKKNTKGFSVEMNFKLFSPMIKSIELKFENKFKKSKLYFLRKIKNKSLKFKKK